MNKRTHRDDGSSQVIWYQNAPSHLVPTGFRSVVFVEYDEVQGWHPKMISSKIVDAAQDLWHCGRERLSTDPAFYTQYVLKRSDHPTVKRACEMIMETELTKVGMCHGDMTFENIILKEDGSVCFIDPGHARGCPCEEIDRGKLLQSVLGWEAVRRKHWVGAPLFAAVLELRRFKPIDFAFGATHIARLLVHHDGQAIRRWAEESLETIGERL